MSSNYLYFFQEQRDLLRSMEVQKNELGSQLKAKRTELQKLKEDIETEDEVLQVKYKDEKETPGI